MIAITKRFFLASPLMVLAGRVFGQPAADDAPTLDPVALSAVAKRAVAQYMLPAYQGLEEATADLVAALPAFCREPAAEPSAAVRDAFKAVLLAWARVDFLRFGPIAEKGRQERFSFLPDPHGTGARQLRRILATPDPALLEPGAIAKLSAAVQGMPALELLLFGGGGESPDYRCALAERIAENLHAIASETLAAWSAPDGWRHLMENPGGGNIVYRDATEPVIEVLKAIGVGLIQLRDQRLLPALGASSAAAKPARGVFVKSGLTLDYLAASGDAIAALIRESEMLSLAPSEAAAFEAETAKGFAAYEAGLAIGPDWTAALQTKAGYDRIRASFDVLKTLEDIYSNRFPLAAGITPGFNALDGD